jgi:hypothetical protein
MVPLLKEMLYVLAVAAALQETGQVVEVADIQLEETDLDQRADHKQFKEALLIQVEETVPLKVVLLWEEVVIVEVLEAAVIGAAEALT